MADNQKNTSSNLIAGVAELSLDTNHGNDKKPIIACGEVGIAPDDKSGDREVRIPPGQCVCGMLIKIRRFLFALKRGVFLYIIKDKLIWRSILGL